MLLAHYRKLAQAVLEVFDSWCTFANNAINVANIICSPLYNLSRITHNNWAFFDELDNLP